MTRTIKFRKDEPLPAVMRFTLPEAPSANRYWRQWEGRTIISRDARQYRKAVADACLRHPGRTGFFAPRMKLAVGITWYRKRKMGDLDNRLKQVIDCLRGIAYSDDSQIVRIVAERHEDKLHPRMEVTIEEAK